MPASSWVRNSASDSIQARIPAAHSGRRWVSTWDAHNLLHFLALRLDKHAQWEVRQYAQIIASIVADWLPLTWEAFVDYRIGALTLSRIEAEALQTVLGSEGCARLLREMSVLGASNREVVEMRERLGGGQ